MTSIYLIRHAEAEGNLYRIAQGQHDSNLTDWGWRQVQALRKRFENVQIDAVYSSDLYRACATASAICQPRGLPLHRRTGLREICVGDWEQRTWGDIARTYPQEMSDFKQRMDRWSIPGAETPAEVQARLLREIRSIAAENPDRTIAVFSHGYAIRLVLAALQGVSLRDTGTKTPTGDNTAVSLLEADGDVLRVVWQNDNRHLLSLTLPSGQKPHKRANALEPGLWYRAVSLKALPEDGPVREAIVSSGAPLRSELHTRVGFRGEEPAALLQTGPGLSDIPDGAKALSVQWLWVREDCRRRGFGIQLIGQAVLEAREAGAGFLLARPEGAENRAFSRYCGFFPAGSGPNMAKDIRFDQSIFGGA